MDNYRELPFPLNVDSYIFASHDLHYGLLENETDLPAAQQHAFELLRQCLPDSSGEVLAITPLLSTLPHFLQKNYQVTTLQYTSPIEQILSAAFESSETNEGFDAIIFHQTSQYVKNLTLFNKAHSLLKENGTLLLLDEVGLKYTADDGVEHLPLLKYRVAQAERCGVKLVEQIDVSAKIIPFLEQLLQRIQKGYQQVLDTFSLSQEKLQEYVDFLHTKLQGYKQQKYGYVLLKFAKTATPRWLLKEVTEHDQAAMRQTFADVFHHDMSPEMWQWKYGNNHGMATAAWQNNRIVAHYGGITRELMYFGQPKTGVQIVDVMVAATDRGVLTRKGPYFLVGATFPECYAGYGAKILLGFGFPTQRAIRTAEKLKVYEEVGKMNEVTWTTFKGKPQITNRIRHLHPLNDLKDREIIDTLWVHMAKDFKQAIIGVRDWPYVHCRYLMHPHKQYELLLISQRFTSKPLGIVVLQRGEEECKLLDIIAPQKHFAVLLKQTRRIVGSWNIPKLTLWITENFVPMFTKLAGDAQAIDVRIPHCIWYEGPPTEEVKDRWWLMGGDTDFM